MFSRWHTIAILAFWLASMTWLVTRKLLPPLVVGEPPNAQAVLEARRREVLVGWELQLNRRPLGWAANRTVPQAGGGAALWSWVHIEGLSLRDAAPAWLRDRLQDAAAPEILVTLDASTCVTANPQGKLAGFRSKLWLRPLAEAIEIIGRMQGNRLSLEARCGELKYATEAFVPADALPTDALSPQSALPGLRIGQAWRLPSCNPLRLPSAALEMIEAAVEAEDTIAWGEGASRVLVVAYRAEAGFQGLESQPLGRLWVRRDGTVLQQEFLFLDRVLRFVRMTPEKAAALRLPAPVGGAAPDKER